MTTQQAADTFVAKWSSVTVNEKAMAQTHFNELCDLVGVLSPLSDPSGLTYRFEKPLTKSGGGAGFADVWRQFIFAWEYKSKGKNLDDAYRQLQLYKEDLDNPPILVVSDIDNIEIHVVFTGYPTVVHKIRNADIARPEFRDVIRWALSEPERLRPRDSTVSMTEKAAAKFATVAQMIEARGYTPDVVAPFFMKILFCLFAEDIGIFPDRVLTKIIDESIRQPAEFAPMTSALFAAVHQGSYFGAGQKLPTVEGSLFADMSAIPLTADELQFLFEAAKLDWSQVEPSIFGTLFERSLDPSKRAQLGAHYTSRDDILLVVEPVLMRPLRHQWEELQATIAPKLQELEGLTQLNRQLAKGRIEATLYQFAYELSTKVTLDPACGSGNFLYVALGQMLDLEKELYTYATGVGLTPPEPAIKPQNFLGIEKNPFAVELARVVLTIGYVQWQYTNGFWQRNQTIQMPDTIANHDAIMEYRPDGTTYRPDWPFAHVIVGNPPFLGDKKMRGELGDAYVDALRTLYANDVPGGADLVCYWFERAREQLVTQKCSRVGLIATQAIRGGANRKVLQRILEHGRIFYAWADRAWVLEGAAVRVSMVAFATDTSLLDEVNILDGQQVNIIHANLSSTATADVGILSVNERIAFLGVMKAGPFDIDCETALNMIQSLNDSGKNNLEVVKPRMNGQDITGRNSNQWLIDFGVSMDLETAKLYELPFAHVQTYVWPIRKDNRRGRMKEFWWLHGESRPGMRRAIDNLARYIATPTVSKYRLFTWLYSPTIPDHQLVVFARDDDYFFGVLHSRVHELWARATGTQLREVESGFRYTPSTCFETFPLPWAPGTEPVTDPRVQAIAAAAASLVAARDAWLNPTDISAAELAKRTLTNLYNQNPPWLRAAHATLDAAVCAAYGWPADIGDDEIIARLLELNRLRAGGV